MIYPSDAWTAKRVAPVGGGGDHSLALRVLDETGDLSAIEQGRLEEGLGPLGLSPKSPGRVRWQNAGQRVAPVAMEVKGAEGETKTLTQITSTMRAKRHRTQGHFLRKAVPRRNLSGTKTSARPTRWADVLSAAKKSPDHSEWNDLLAGVGFGDTMQRLSSYYQNNAILAGLLASILFSTMAGAKLFDLERGTLSCPVSGTQPCMLTRSPYEPQQLQVSHHVFYLTGYCGLIDLMCIIIVCVVADNGLKTVSTEEELKAFMSVFSFVQVWLAPALYTSVVFLGFHFASLILVHMYFSIESMIASGASVFVTFVILFMSRKASIFSQQQKVIKSEKERLAQLASAPPKSKPKKIFTKLKQATTQLRRGELPMDDASEV